MRHNRLTTDPQRRLRMESHNHDSAGWVLGTLAAGITLSQARAAVAGLPEPTADDTRRCHSRRAYMTEQLRSLGLLCESIVQGSTRAGDVFVSVDECSMIMAD